MEVIGGCHLYDKGFLRIASPDVHKKEIGLYNAKHLQFKDNKIIYYGTSRPFKYVLILFKYHAQ